MLFHYELQWLCFSSGCGHMTDAQAWPAKVVKGLCTCNCVCGCVHACCCLWGVCMWVCKMKATRQIDAMHCLAVGTFYMYVKDAHWIEIGCPSPEAKKKRKKSQLFLCRLSLLKWTLKCTHFFLHYGHSNRIRPHQWKLFLLTVKVSIFYIERQSTNSYRVCSL